MHSAETHMQQEFGLSASMIKSYLDAARNPAIDKKSVVANYEKSKKQYPSAPKESLAFALIKPYKMYN